MSFSLRGSIPPLIALVWLAGSGAAHADFLNGGFEDPTSLNHWVVTGYAQTVTSSFGKVPPEGTYQAYIDNDTTPRPTAAVDVSTLETSLGLTEGTLSSLQQGGSPLGTVINGSAISQTITANLGDTLAFTWDFLTAEDPNFDPQNDFAFAVVDGNAFVLGSYADATTPLPFNGSLISPSTDDYLSETGYQDSTYAFTSTGTHTVSFGVVNVGNNGITSSLLLDKAAVVPEPGMALPLALGAIALLGGISIRRRRTMSKVA